jgi:hypothetical protein
MYSKVVGESSDLLPSKEYQSTGVTPTQIARV